MLEKLIELDKSLLLFLNGLYTSFGDYFFWNYTQTLTWLPALLVLLYVLIKTKGVNTVWIVIGIALVITIVDQLSSGLLKPLVERWRPSRDPVLSEFVHIVNDYRGGRFGFTSSHASNSFGVALFLSLLFRNKYFTLSIFAWATVNAYSRIYLGVHYPGDVICGALIGLAGAYLVYILLKKFRPQIYCKLHAHDSYSISLHNSKMSSTGFLYKDIHIAIAALFLSVAIIAYSYLI